jgi:heme-degrading monooxygenase HmoA
MILEVAILDVKSGLEAELEMAFGKAQGIISGMQGYVSSTAKVSGKN